MEAGVGLKAEKSLEPAWDWRAQGLGFRVEPEKTGEIFTASPPPPPRTALGPYLQEMAS